MGTRRTRITLAALLIAVLSGLAVGAVSQMTAVSVVDPRPSVPPPSPIPEPTAAPTPPPTPAPTPTPETAEVWVYTIEAGESLSAIAIRFGTTTEELLALNPEYEGNENLVEAGAEMIVPCTPIAAAEDRC